MVMFFNTINDRIASIRVNATPFNLSIMQVYAPTIDNSDVEITKKAAKHDLKNRKTEYSSHTRRLE